jgi:hypothetical protein
MRSSFLKTVFGGALLMCLSASSIWAKPLDAGLAEKLAALPLRQLQREFPNKLDHVINGPGDLVSPKQLHPAFYGSYDWHSSVHGHWMLVRLLVVQPQIPSAAKIRTMLKENLSAENIAQEVAYLGQENRQSFERPYGWAWLLKLQQELLDSKDPELLQLAKNLDPLAKALVQRYLKFFPKQTYPIRSGVHSDTAFGLTFALDYARSAKDKKLENLLVAQSKRYYLKDKNFPLQWEPGGDQFLSPGLGEADLMRRVLAPREFELWLRDFLPELAAGKLVLKPAVVADRSDPKLVHLDGLNLSRAWALEGIMSALPAGHPAQASLSKAVEAHLEAGLAHVASGDYAGEHWLASFAIYALTRGSAPGPLNRNVTR